ncbi:MAG TPA: ClpX C4-type zinc finger protein [Vicinamibacterales bacterium]|nr:ClpX C4-type zinc finger protein [Vicinamibacterales bacterium]
MPLDPHLVEQARAAAAQLAEAERASLLSRADYHTAVRRLHLAGGSLREIAQALSLSHQRVQQIVDAAGGSWWRRVWRSRNIQPDAACTWCGRPPAEVEKLIAGPHVYICDVCVHAAEATAAGDASAPGPFAHSEKKNLGARCAFCGKRASHGRSLVSAAPGHVCSECLRTCREILT